MKQYIGVEIGGTKQQLAAFDENGVLLERISERIPLPNGAVDIRNWIRAQLPRLINDQTVGIGVGFGGILDSRTGVSFASVHVEGWDQFPLKQWFEQTFGLPTTVVNDTVCGGYAEVLFGTGRDVDYFFYTNIGTGCGGALFIKGKNYDGWGTGGAYMGQMFIPSFDDKTDAVRMETVCAGSFWEKRLRAPHYIPEDSLLYRRLNGSTEAVRCADLCQAAREGDPFSLNEIDRWARHYAFALANFIVCFAIQRVSIGGGVANSGEIVLSPIRKHVDELTFLSVAGQYEIVRCTTLDDAVILGAAMYARDGFDTI